MVKKCVPSFVPPPVHMLSPTLWRSELRLVQLGAYRSPETEEASSDIDHIDKCVKYTNAATGTKA